MDPGPEGDVEWEQLGTLAAAKVPEGLEADRDRLLQERRENEAAARLEREERWWEYRTTRGI